MKIIKAQSEHMDKVRDLFREYQHWLDADVCFQGFEEELADLSERYAAPKGAIYLAIDTQKDKQKVGGCVAIKASLNTNTTDAELKRLFVQEAYRGQGLGRDLFNTAMLAAQQMDYDAVVLETLPKKMKAAQRLYRDYGFMPMKNYVDNKDKGVECLRYCFKDNA